MSEATLAVEARGLTRVYGAGSTEVVAMADVDLEVRRGEIVALLGPSGAGKSTLLMAMGLIETPTSGQLWLEGELVSEAGRSLVDSGRYRRERLGFVFQRSNLVPFLDALENVALPAMLTGTPDRMARSRAAELLETLGVGPQAASFPSALSGGQQQRVAVARSLVNRPALILADEPTAALDSVRGRQVMELFRTVSREHGAAVVVVTHDHRALDVFDRTLEMEDGRLAPGPGNQAPGS